MDKSIPIEVCSEVVTVSTSIVDRITGNRSDYPLLLAYAVKEILKARGFESQIIYGKSAWVEVLEDQSLKWAYCSEENPHFWVIAETDELIDLSLSAATKKKTLHSDSSKAVYSPPMIWSDEVPGFCQYEPIGIAEIDPKGDRDQKWFESVKKNIDHHRKSNTQKDFDFPNEPIIRSGRQLLDDSQETFKHYDRAISVSGLPHFDQAAFRSGS